MRAQNNDSTLISVLKYRARVESDQPAYTFLNGSDKNTLTNQELLQKVTEVASRLLLITKSGSRAIILLQPGLDYIAAFLGCLMAGVVAVPAYPPASSRHAQRLFSVITDASAEVLITTYQIANQFAFDSMRLLLIDQSELIDIDEKQFPLITRDKLAFLQYTSGSTGTPKGVMVSHNNIMANTEVITKLLRREVQRVCSWLPPFHDMGLIGGILYPLTVGAHTILMAPATFLKKPFFWLKTISDNQVDISPAPNFAYELCINTVTEEEKMQLDLSHWQTALNGAEPVNAKTLERFAHAFASCGFKIESCYPAYGMAETTLMVSGKKSGEATVVLNVNREALQAHKIKKVEAGHANKLSLVSCGIVDKDHKIKIIAPDSNSTLSIYEIGEIVIAGPSVTQGYWNKPEITRQQFGWQPPDSEQKFFRTGDLGFIDENGELFITGRLKDLIIIRGQNIYPQDIEAATTESHPHLIPYGAAAFVLGTEDECELVIVQEVHRHAKNFDEIFAAILNRCSEEFSILPTQIVLIKQSTLPKTSSGKVQRSQCRQDLLNEELKVVAKWQRGMDLGLEGQSEPVLDDLQLWMKQWFATELKLDAKQINPHINFAYYGVDSLKAVQFCAALEQKLNKTINPSIFWTYSTIDQLATYLSGKATEDNKQQQVQEQQFEPIAIIGMSCRFPGQAHSPEMFWELLKTSGDGITEIPANRWDIDDYYDSRPATPGKMISRKGGFIDRIDEFDAALFNIGDTEADEMDPQHRLLLELTWEALEYGGIAPLSLKGTDSGIFIGISSNDYSHLNTYASHQTINGFYGLSNAHSAAAGRIAYFLGTHGQALAVDTACSSSLVAVFNACQDLQDKACDLAIAGGVNIILDPGLSISFSQAGMLSPRGKCQAFDANADGYVRSEGAGVVILKRLADAKRDGNNVLAVIKSAAVNSDGHSNGITAPNPIAQKALISKAINLSGLSADEISYVEAHGTGTRLGDPIEFNALKNVFATGSRKQPLHIGSVKTNIGHLEAAAGLAGLIKIVLMLQNKQIPANLHFRNANPLIDLNQIPSQVPVELKPWKTTQEQPIRYAGVSSFGFTGTNAHIILAEAPPAEKKQAVSVMNRPVHILTLSGHSPEALNAQRNNLLALIEQDKDLDLASLCHRFNTERSRLSYRLALHAKTTEELKIQLQAYSIEPVPSYSFQKVAFLFTGMGSQYSGMGSELYATQPLFKAEVDYCCQILSEYLDEPLQEVMFNPEKQELLQQTQYAQPALFVLEYALAKLWLSWGIKPTAVIGHSLGEYVAATVAGMLGLEDGLKLVAHRARLMQMQQQGAMLAVALDSGLATELLVACQEAIPSAILAIAAVNCPTQVVFSGEKQAIEKLEIICQQRQIKTTKLDVSHAFHSDLMHPMISEFIQVAQEITYYQPTMLVISNVTGKALKTVDANYWAEHALTAVNFSAGIGELLTEKYDVFLEIGSQPVLLSFAMAHHNKPEDALWLASLKKQHSDWQILSETLVSIYLSDGNINWQSFDKPYSIEPYLKVLPTYPFQRQSHWLSIDYRRTEAAEVANFISQAVYQLNWEKLLLTDAKQNKKVGTWLIFTNENDENIDIGQRLKRYFQHAILIKPGKQYEYSENLITLNPLQPEHFQQLVSEITEPAGIIYLWGLQSGDFICTNQLSTVSKEDFHQIIQNSCAGLLHLVQSLIGQNYPIKIWVGTRAAISPSAKQCMPLSMPLVGMCKTLNLEYPELTCQLIDFEAVSSNKEVATYLTQIIDSDDEESVVAVSQQEYFVPRLCKSSLKEDSTAEIINANTTYLITGGLGGLGFTLSRWLIEQGAKYIALLGRRDYKEVQAQLNSLVSDKVTISYFQVNVSDFKQLKNTLLTIRETMPAVSSIFHTAGVLANGLWTNLTWPQFEEVFQAKVQGSWYLHTLSVELELKLQHFVLFSSISSILGSVGQANYAAANAFLDGLAHFRHQKGLSAIAVNFGPWQQLGMTLDKEQSWLDVGIENIPRKYGLAALKTVMSSPHRQLCVLPNTISQDKLKKFPLTHRKFLSRIINEQAEKPINTMEEERWLKLKNASSKERLLYIDNLLISTIKAILRLGENTQITRDSTLLSLGIDSLLAVDLLHRLKGKLPPDINLTVQVLLFENHSIQALIELLCQKMNDSLDASKERKQDDSHAQSLTRFLPLSVQQTRIWHHIQQQPDNPAYLVTYFLELNGRVDADILEKSIEQVINRHDMLRCSFHTYLGSVFQFCHEEVEFRLERLDFGNLSTSQQDLCLKEELNQIAHYQFDLTQAPLLKSTFIKCANDRIVWAVGLSHLLTDGASSLIILQDILHCYQLNTKNSDEPLQPVVSYQTFVNWQLAGLMNGNYQRYVTFWREKLQNYEPPNLPTDKSIPDSALKIGGKEIISVSMEQLNALVQLAKENQTTITNILLGVYAFLLANMAKTNHAFIMILTSGRELDDYETTVGNIANEVPAIIRYEQQSSFIEFIKCLQENLAQSLPYQYLQPEQMAELHLPIPDVSFDFQVLKPRQFDVGFSMRPISLEQSGLPLWGSNPRKLSLKWTYNGALSGYIKYRTDLYDSETVANLVQQFMAVISQIVKNPTIKCRDLITLIGR